MSEFREMIKISKYFDESDTKSRVFLPNFDGILTYIVPSDKILYLVLKYESLRRVFSEVLSTEKGRGSLREDVFLKIVGSYLQLSADDQVLERSMPGCTSAPFACSQPKDTIFIDIHRKNRLSTGSG